VSGFRLLDVSQVILSARLVNVYNRRVFFRVGQSELGNLDRRFVWVTRLAFRVRSGDHHRRRHARILRSTGHDVEQVNVIILVHFQRALRSSEGVDASRLHALLGLLSNFRLGQNALGTGGRHQPIILLFYDGTLCVATESGLFVLQGVVDVDLGSHLRVHLRSHVDPGSLLALLFGFAQENL